MTDPRKEPFAHYLRAVADLMELRDWTVRIDYDPPDSRDDNANADPWYGRKVIAIRLSESFLNSRPEEQRQTVVHELVHAHLAPMHLFLHKELGVGKPDNAAWEAYKLTMEYGVDGIAEGWAKSLPLPDDFNRPERSTMKAKAAPKSPAKATPKAGSKPAAKPKAAPKTGGKAPAVKPIAKPASKPVAKPTKAPSKTAAKAK